MSNAKPKYYIFTPANVCSGGPEALHQLSYYMRLCSLESYIVYYDYSGFISATPIQRYLQYEPRVVSYEEIEDSKQNFCIAPENAPWCLNSIKNAKKCIWWLSYLYNELKIASPREKMHYLLRMLRFKNVQSARTLLYDPNHCLHLCGSKFAYNKVLELFSSSKIEYLVEPISKIFLLSQVQMSNERKDMVLYNPAKPSLIMTHLLESGKFCYVPLKGYSPNELIRLYSDAKLYVDFGEFSGPERIPKEAVFFGCNILVANHNAAANDFDVAIPLKYKISDNASVKEIEKTIEYMLKNYETLYGDFESFRQKIIDLEYNFIKQINSIFSK